MPCITLASQMEKLSSKSRTGFVSMCEESRKNMALPRKISCSGLSLGLSGGVDVEIMGPWRNLVVSARELILGPWFFSQDTGTFLNGCSFFREDPVIASQTETWVVESVMCLPSKHQDLIFCPRSYLKKPWSVVQACNPSPREVACL